MNIAIIGGLNWFGRGLLETTANYNYVFNIIDNCSSPNSCKTLFENQDRYRHCSIGNLRPIIQQCQFVIFNISSSSDIVINHEINNLFFKASMLCKEFDKKIIFSLDNDEFTNYYKNYIINKLGCRYACIQHNSNIIGTMKKRDKIEELMFHLSTMSRVDIKNQEFRYTTTTQVIYTYLQALSIDGHIQLPYQSINESSIFYTIQNKLPKDKYLYYRLDGEICKQLVLEDYIYPLIEKYFKLTFGTFSI
jgi:hypothetical protein